MMCGPFKAAGSKEPVFVNAAFVRYVQGDTNTLRMPTGVTTIVFDAPDLKVEVVDSPEDVARGLRVQEP